MEKKMETTIVYWGYIRVILRLCYIIPMLWFYIPCVIIVCGTSNGPQHDIGNCLAPVVSGSAQDDVSRTWHFRMSFLAGLGTSPFCF